MKITLRIPTKEQYAYVEAEIETGVNDLESSFVKKIYDELTHVMNDSGTSEGKFKDYVVNLMNSDLTEWGNVEDYNEMNQSQKDIVQSIKRFYKRLPKE